MRLFLFHFGILGNNNCHCPQSFGVRLCPLRFWLGANCHRGGVQPNRSSRLCPAICYRFRLRGLRLELPELSKRGDNSAQGRTTAHFHPRRPPGGEWSHPLCFCGNGGELQGEKLFALIVFCIDDNLPIFVGSTLTARGTR